MISIDLTKIKRFKRVSNQAILKFLHPLEIEQYRQLEKQKKPTFLATRW
ncbi:Uncharacterised protein, partial [Metamycoplasma alkalescens]